MSNEKEILTEEDKKFIIDNYSKMSVYQLAIRLNIKTENRKCPIILDFIKNSGLQITPNSQPVSADVKATPLSPEEIVKSIIEEKNIDVDNPDAEIDYQQVSIEEFANVLKELHIFVRTPISEKEKKDITFLINQMQSRRYLYNYKSYKKREYKDLFREEFVRALYGKGDMPQDEVNDYIDVCNEIVFQYDIKCKIREIEKMKDSPGNSVAQIVAFDSLILNLNDQNTNSTKRAGEIKKTLGVNREQRLKDSRPQGLTVLALIEAFQDNEKRAALMKLQENKDKEIRDTMQVLDEMDATKALILGVGIDEILQGGL